MRKLLSAAIRTASSNIPAPVADIPKPGDDATPVASTVIPEAPAAATPVIAKPVNPNGRLAATQRTIDLAAYPFNDISNRDDAYLVFFAYAATLNGGAFTLAELQAAGQPSPCRSDSKRTRNPFSDNPSAKSTDAGAIERAVKRGVLNFRDGSYTLTEASADLKPVHAGIGHAFAAMPVAAE